MRENRPTVRREGWREPYQGAATTAAEVIEIAAAGAFTAPIEFADGWVLGTSPRIARLERADKMTRNPHHGSNFEDFLAEKGILEECRLAATKKVIAMQMAMAVKAKGLTKTAFAAEMDTRAQLDPDNDSVTFATLKRAAKALGKELRLEMD
jgi:antitoxin HicB